MSDRVHRQLSHLLVQWSQPRQAVPVRPKEHSAPEKRHGPRLLRADELRCQLGAHVARDGQSADQSLIDLNHRAGLAR